MCHCQPPPFGLATRCSWMTAYHLWCDRQREFEAEMYQDQGQRYLELSVNDRRRYLPSRWSAPQLAQCWGCVGKAKLMQTYPSPCSFRRLSSFCAWESGCGIRFGRRRNSCRARLNSRHRIAPRWCQWTRLGKQTRREDSVGEKRGVVMEARGAHCIV